MARNALLEVNLAATPVAVATDWRALAERALVPAGLNGPELLLPLLECARAARLATVSAAGELLLAMPLARRRPGLLGSLITPLRPSGLPHVDSEMAAAALEALLAGSGRPLLLRGIPAEGPFWAALIAAAGRLAILSRWQRAALRPSGDFEGWYQRNIDGKRRKEYRRLRARLAGEGPVTLQELAPGGNLQPFMAELLTLEAAGWKGRRGTAIACDPSLAAAFTAACEGLHCAGKLRFWSLRCGARTLASLYAVKEGDTLWLGKIAYDEEFARFSPGVLLILDVTARIFAEPAIRLADSCAIPGHPMIDHIWRDRIAMADIMVASPDIGAMRFAVLTTTERLRRGVRGAFRDALYRLAGRHRS